MRTAFLIVVLLLAQIAAQAQRCPQPLAAAKRLVLVVAPKMSSTIATVRHFVRASPEKPWQQVGGPVSALIGRRGVAWAHMFRAYARKGEPIKIDGDERAPAGFFRIGRSFGFGASRLPGYLRLKTGPMCVDDPALPAYNAITTRARVGWRVHGENTWRASAYRRGLVVNYPTNRRHRASSCIFIHLRLPRVMGTAGCVALPERQVVRLQYFAQRGSVLAILPRRALSRFKGCLP
jgi:L,D-peptidoglycan transpeptidase YkuD (ErfK/YbiS/YcfS/YnhG family)